MASQSIGVNDEGVSAVVQQRSNERQVPVSFNIRTDNLGVRILFVFIQCRIIIHNVRYPVEVINGTVA